MPFVSFDFHIKLRYFDTTMKEKQVPSEKAVVLFYSDHADLCSSSNLGLEVFVTAIHSITIARQL